MHNHFHGNNANEVWLQAINTLHNHGSLQMTRLGESKELIHSSFEIKNPTQRWISARTPTISPAFAIAEIFWILNGDNNSNFINSWNPKLPEYSGTGITYHGAYGQRIKRHFGIDQLEAAYHALKYDQDTRQVVIQLWDPKIDMPKEDGKPASEDIPCNICSIPKIRNGKLEWLQIMRSNDIFLGTPYNIIQFTTLQEILAGWLGVRLGTYYQISDSLHAYCRDMDKYTFESKYTEIKNTDTLALDKSLSNEIIRDIYIKLNILIKDDLSKKDMSSLISDCKSEYPCGYGNLFLICCAYAARKRGWASELEGSIALCTNSTLTTIWKKWAG